MAASGCLIQEVDGKAGSGCCRGWLSTTCVQWAPGASWSLNLCTLLKRFRESESGWGANSHSVATTFAHFWVYTKKGSSTCSHKYLEEDACFYFTLFTNLISNKCSGKTSPAQAMS